MTVKIAEKNYSTFRMRALLPNFVLTVVVLQRDFAKTSLQIDAVLSEPPCAPSRKCTFGVCRRHLDESEIANDFAFYCINILKLGGCVVVLVDFSSFMNGLSSSGIQYLR